LISLTISRSICRSAFSIADPDRTGGALGFSSTSGGGTMAAGTETGGTGAATGCAGLEGAFGFGNTVFGSIAFGTSFLLGTSFRAALLFPTFTGARFIAFTFGAGLRTRLLAGGFLAMGAFRVMQVYIFQYLLQDRHHCSRSHLEESRQNSGAGPLSDEAPAVQVRL
jgi:hypothetical protein